MSKRRSEAMADQMQLEFPNLGRRAAQKAGDIFLALLDAARGDENAAWLAWEKRFGDDCIAGKKWAVELMSASEEIRTLGDGELR